MNKNTFNAAAEWMLEALKSGKLKKDDLTPRQRKVIVDFIVEEQLPMSFLQIGNLIGVTRQHAGLLYSGAIRNRRWQITELDIVDLATKSCLGIDSILRKALNPPATETIIRQETVISADGKEKTRIEEKVIKRPSPDLAIALKAIAAKNEVLWGFGFAYKAPEHKVLELPISSTLTDLMKELVSDGKGIPSRTAFLARLRELASGNGDLGDGAGETRELPIFASLGDGNGERGSSANG